MTNLNEILNKVLKTNYYRYHIIERKNNNNNILIEIINKTNDIFIDIISIYEHNCSTIFERNGKVYFINKDFTITNEIII